MIQSIIRKLKISSLISTVTYTYKEQEILIYLDKLFSNVEKFEYNDIIYYMDPFSHKWIMDMKECVEENTNVSFIRINLNVYKTQNCIHTYKIKHYIEFKDLLIYMIKNHYKLNKSKKYKIHFLPFEYRIDIEKHFKNTKIVFQNLIDNE